MRSRTGSCARCGRSGRAIVEAVEPRMLLSVSMVKDIIPGTGGSYPLPGGVDLNGELLFPSRSPSGFTATDGTAAGTVSLSSTLEIPHRVFVVGGLAIAGMPLGIQGLWESDGTPGGTRQISSANISQIVDAEGTIYGLETVPGVSTPEIVRLDIASGALQIVGSTPSIGGSLYLSTRGSQVLANMTATSTTPATLYALQADGSLLALGPGGYRVTTDPQPNGQDAAVLNGVLYYTGLDTATGFTALFSTDGTPAGTTLVTDLGNATGNSVYVTPVGGRLYFNCSGQIWSTDGTAAGTAALMGGGMLANPVAFGPHVYFLTTDSNGFELYRTDGTPASTTLVQNLGASGSGGGGMASFAGTLIVQTYTQFWFGDGTPGGMQAVPGLAPGYGANCILGEAGGRLFISANTPQYGSELWAFDAPGTISGHVFNDANHDAARQPLELGMPGVTVYLDANNNGKLDAGETSTLTDSNGNYTFYNLPAGDYAVREVLPAGYALTAPAPSSGPLSLSATQTVRGPVFGNVPVSSVTLDLSYFLTLTRNFGKPGTFAGGDLNGDGTINLDDLLLLVRNFGHPLANAAPAAVAPAIFSPRPARRVR